MWTVCCVQECTYAVLLVELAVERGDYGDLIAAAVQPLLFSCVVRLEDERLLFCVIVISRTIVVIIWLYLPCIC